MGARGALHLEPRVPHLPAPACQVPYDERSAAVRLDKDALLEMQRSPQSPSSPASTSTYTGIYTASSI